MTAVLRLFWNICLLRDGPETVPTHTWFLVSLIAAELAMGVVLSAVLYPDLSLALWLNLAAINLAVTASIAWFALYLRNSEQRFPATLGAILGTEVLIDAVGALAMSATSGGTRVTTGWILTLWGVAVVGFILHRALATRLWAGILLSFAIALLGILVAIALLGELIASSSTV
ncbi:MAG: hypothetical protein F4029_03875 [Gammaproteobacteria bacterium]|nr:hypothetical protein [Gammaproteobacteria bacterium]MXY57427.1 hypothetical protein [Gammaproteobacteria bacterium]MYF29416.1 hypothetical protein [Gammaproteobacteria bacterium]MYK45348.1 hypothetical protein [Gammaproteobacteria bacterium]